MTDLSILTRVQNWNSFIWNTFFHEMERRFTCRLRYFPNNNKGTIWIFSMREKKENSPYCKPCLFYFQLSEVRPLPVSVDAHTLLRSAWRSQQTFLFLFCFFFFFIINSFLFFSTATCVLRFLRQFSTNLDEIWHVDSPWWDEQTEYFFKSIGPGVGTGRGPKVLLCFIIGKTLYTLRRDKNFT